MLLEVTCAADPDGTVVIQGTDAGTFTKYDELTGGITTWHKWIFTFDGIDPCWMAEDLTSAMYLGYYSSTQGKYIKTSKRLTDDNTYSIAEYCNDVYNYITNGNVDPYNTQSDYYDDMKAVLADIMMYGETAQLFQHFNTDTLCSKVDWAYRYDGRGEIVERILIDTKPTTDYDTYSEDNQYWDVNGDDAIAGANNLIFDDKEGSGEDGDRWSWIDEYRTNTATGAENQISSDENQKSITAKGTRSDLAYPDTDDWGITGLNCMFGKGGYIMPRFYFKANGDLTNYYVKAERTQSDGTKLTKFYRLSTDNVDPETGYYVVDLGLAGDTSFQMYPQEFGDTIKITLCIKNSAGSGIYNVQSATYSINTYFYQWVHFELQYEDMKQQMYMMDLAYAAYRYGQSTKTLYNDIVNAQDAS